MKNIYEEFEYKDKKELYLKFVNNEYPGGKI